MQTGLWQKKSSHRADRRALRDLMPPSLLTKAWPSESFYVVEPDSELLTTGAMLSAAQGCYRGVVRWVVRWVVTGTAKHPACTFLCPESLADITAVVVPVALPGATVVHHLAN